MAELERCLDLLRDIDRRAAAREVPFEFGTAYLHDSVPRVWSRNYLRADMNLPEASAEQLAAEADRVLGEAGIAHRKVEVYDREAGASLEPGFRALGWETECDVVMVAGREPDRPTDASRAGEVSFRDLVPVWAEAARGDRHVADEDVVRQLAEGKRILMAAIETRFFAARVEGEVGGYCELYSAAGTGQIENVLTLERFRNRGLARATVLHALEESQTAGNDLTFLLADSNDWPKELYSKLGFDEVGFVYDFVRPAAR